MSLYLRFGIDGAVPLSAGATTSMTLAQVVPHLPPALQTKIAAIKAGFLDLKSYCAKIGGKENTVRFSWHTCDHEFDAHSPCVEKDI